MKNITFVRSFAGIDEYVLENGLKVLLFKEPSQANVTVNITYLVGSRHEGKGEAGMAHLLEHMLFKNTSSCKDIKKVLQDKGASFNATTWFDRTNYFETLTPSKENLEFALSLEADRMLNSTILQSDLDAEMTVVRNEFEMGENNPVHVLHDQMMSAAYRWHSYGKTTIGNRSDIERVPATKLRNFYEHYYQPDNAVLLIAGQFIYEDAFELINKYFSSIKKPNRILDSTYTQEPAQDGPRSVTLERVGDLASIGLAYHIPSIAHEDSAAIKIFLDIITDEPNGILYKELVASFKCSELFQMVYTLCEPGMALCFIRVNKENSIEECQNLFIDFLENKSLKSIEEKDIERTKAKFNKKFKLSIANAKDMAIKLSEFIACGDWRLFFWYAEQIKKVTINDVARVANKYFIRSNRTLGIFKPITDVIRADIDNNLDITKELDTLKENIDFQNGEEFIVKSDTIELFVKRENFENISIASLYKKTRNAQVRSKIIFYFGNEEVIKPYVEELSLIPSLIFRGCKKYSYQEIKDKLDSLCSSLELSGGIGTLIATIKSDKNNYLQVVELLKDILSEPLFLTSEFEIIKNREIDDYEEIKNDPQKIAFNELERLKSMVEKDSIYYVETFDEKIQKLKSLTLNNIIKAYDIMKDVSTLNLSVVGDYDCQDLAKVLKSYFLLKPKNKFSLIVKPYMKNSIEKKTIFTKDKEMSLLSFGFNFALQDNNEDYPALKIANYIFGETMNSRLMARIREKEGISYGAGSWLEVSRHTDSASFTMYAMSAAENVVKAKNAMLEEWQIFIEKGVNIEELKESQISMFANYENMLANDSYIASSLANDFLVNRNFTYKQNIFSHIKNLNKNDVNSAIKKWFLAQEFSMVIAGDLE